MNDKKPRMGDYEGMRPGEREWHYYLDKAINDLTRARSLIVIYRYRALSGSEIGELSNGIVEAQSAIRELRRFTGI